MTSACLLFATLSASESSASRIEQRRDTVLQSLNLSVAMAGQSVAKCFLAEGDQFLISGSSPLEDQNGHTTASIWYVESHSAILSLFPQSVSFPPFHFPLQHRL